MYLKTSQNVTNIWKHLFLHLAKCNFMDKIIVILMSIFSGFDGQIVDMRVGIHSGRVIYGIVGGKRYKFDVYSKGNQISK